MNLNPSNSNEICIAIDAMGGDFGPSTTVPATIDVLKKFPELKIILVGDTPAIERHFDKLEVSKNILSRIEIVHSQCIVTMDDLPSDALRRKKDSSMRLALDLVQNKRAQACVSAGNTGALMMMARFVLKMIEGVERPAILSSMPSKKGNFYMLDLGANVGCDVKNLVQFAIMGSVLVSQINNNPHPKIALLNIGKEQTKGTEPIKQAASILQNNPEIVNYISYAEGNDIFSGEFDVVVCDGFAGNIALKVSEGLASLLIHFIREGFKANFFSKIVGFFALSILKKVFARINPEHNNGGSFLGLQDVVIKSHGGANRNSFLAAIERAILEVKMNVPEKIKYEVQAKLLNIDQINR